jgi:hypothetical protein
MTGNPDKQFGKRQPPPAEPAAPAKRSRHVALLLMGTMAVGGGAYAMMPRENCDPNNSALTSTQRAECQPRQSSSSSGGHGSSGGSSSDTAIGHTTRGGFGSFGHAIASHFSGGG